MKKHIKYREMLFNGKLYMPKIKKIKNIYGKKVYSEIESMFEAMWFQYLVNGNESTVSLPYWAKRIQNPNAMNIALKLLSDAGWIVSKSLSINNWGEAYLVETKLLEYVSKKELASIRKQYKFSKYILKYEDDAKSNSRTRMNGVVRNTGIVREGFRQTGNTVFEFDLDTMEKYKDQVILLINKSIDKMAIKYPQILDDLANYAELGKEIVDYYLWDNGQYTAGQNTNDSRGRNISGMLNKIGNPIGFKVMRSLLVIPESNRNIATAKGLRNKYLFIAEILGYKSGNVNGKVNYGRRAYFNKSFIQDCNIDELYENIWLERLYADIDNILDIDNWKKKTALAKYHTNSMSMTICAKKIETFSNRRWKVPIEIDMSNSIAGIMGLLLNHKPFMERTNMIGKTIDDAWKLNGISNRIQAKTLMRVMYGSSMPARKMWTEMKIPYTTEEVMEFEKEIDIGEFAVANRLKNFIIQNVKPKEKMKINLNGEIFNIECNKFFNIGEVTNKFDLYDSYSNSIRRIMNTETIKKPNLERFKLFFVTALV